MMIEDPSVSRIHAELRYVNKNCYLTNMYSRFGTLMTLKLPIRIKPQGLSIQVGCTLLKLSHKIIKSCCCNNNNYNQVVHPDEMNDFINNFYKEIEKKNEESKNSE